MEISREIVHHRLRLSLSLIIPLPWQPLARLSNISAEHVREQTSGRLSFFFSATPEAQRHTCDTVFAEWFSRSRRCVTERAARQQGGEAAEAAEAGVESYSLFAFHATSGLLAATMAFL